MADAGSGTRSSVGLIVAVAGCFDFLFGLPHEEGKDSRRHDLDGEVGQDHSWPVHHQERRHPGDDSETEVKS